jgi:hypothetical protein
MGKLIKKMKFGQNNTVKKAAKAAVMSAVGALGSALLDGWHGTVELKNGREISVKSLPADHPYFAVSVNRKENAREIFITSAVLLTLITVTANRILFTTHNKNSKHGNYIHSI